jgi:hypothetical protein
VPDEGYRKAENVYEAEEVRRFQDAVLSEDDPI